MKKVLLFDFDGTLIDTVSGSMAALKKLSKKYKDTSIDNAFHSLQDFPLFEMFHEARVSILWLPYVVYRTKKQIIALQAIDGMREILIQLKKEGYILGVLTSNLKRNVSVFLKYNNLDMFSIIKTSVGLSSKDKVIKRACKEQNISLSECIYIGDEIRDIIATKKAGVDIIAVTWGLNSSKGLMAYHPEYIARSPSDIPAILKNI